MSKNDIFIKLLIDAQQKRKKTFDESYLAPLRATISKFLVSNDPNDIIKHLASIGLTESKNLINYLHNLIDECKLSSAMFIETNPDDIKSDLESLGKKNDFKLTYCSSELRDIRFITRAVLYERNPATRTVFDVDLGLFEIRLLSDYGPISDPSSAYKVTATATGENKPKKINGGTCYHPHISADGKLCVGTYLHQMTRDYAELNIMSIIFNVCGLINRYNANSLMYPSAYIHNWIGQKCPVCSLFITPKTEVVTKSKLEIHKDCGVEVDGEYYAASEIRTCSKCSCSTPHFIALSKTDYVCIPCSDKKD